MDVGAWLSDLGLAECAEAFATNGIDAAMLPELNNEDLKDLGVTRLADRKRLLKAIEELAGGANRDEPARTPVVTPVGERRQVTVLFADIAGFTRLTSALGAEAWPLRSLDAHPKKVSRIHPTRSGITCHFTCRFSP